MSSSHESGPPPEPQPEPEPEPRFWWSADEETSRQQLLEKYKSDFHTSTMKDDSVEPSEVGEQEELEASVSDEISLQSSQPMQGGGDSISPTSKIESKSNASSETNTENPVNEASSSASYVENAESRKTDISSEPHTEHPSTEQPNIYKLENASEETAQDSDQNKIQQTSLTPGRGSGEASSIAASVDQSSEIQAGSSNKPEGNTLQDSTNDNEQEKEPNDPSISLGSDDLSLSQKQFTAVASSTFRISDPSQSVEIERLKAENQEQEHLLRAYQKENERLYLELKHAKHQLKNKFSELKAENEHLGFIVAQLREEVQMKESLKNSPFTVKQKSVASSTGSSLQSSPTHKPESEEVRMLKETTKQLSADVARLKNQLKSEQEMVAILRTTVEDKNKTIQLKSKQIAVLEKKNIMLGDRLRSIPKMATQVSSATQKKLKNSPSKQLKSANEKVAEADSSIEISTTSPKRLMMQSTYTKLNETTVEATTHDLLQQRVLELQKKLQAYEAEKKQSLEVLESKFASLKAEYTKRLEQQSLNFLKEKAELVNKICALETNSTSERQTVVEPIKHQATRKPVEMHSKTIQVTLLKSQDVGDLLEINGTLQNKIEQLIKQVRESEMKLKLIPQLEQENAALGKQVEAVLKQLHEAEVKLKRIAQLEKLNTALEKQVEAKSQRLKEMETRLKDKTQLEKENAALEKQVRELEVKVFKALESQTVESKQFKAMNEEITLLESRHHQREKALQNYIKKMQVAHQKALLAEANKWRARLTEQFNEVDYFRMQLDSVVEVLEELKRRGVYVPIASALNH